MHRLRRRGEFAEVLRHGRRSAGALVVVHHRRGAASTPPRVGFVVSRAVGGATVRNLVRRRLRHLVAARLDQLPMGSGLVVRALPASATATSGALGAGLDAALGSAGVLT